MTYSEKLTSIPNDSSRALQTYLSKVDSGELKHATRQGAAKESGVDLATVATIFSEMVNEGHLTAKIKPRCPECGTSYGQYERISEVPEENKVCFDCGRTFELNADRNWNVVYEVESDVEDFFRNPAARVRAFTAEGKDVSPSYLQSELENFRDMESPQKRGRDFDYLMGLVFQQLPGAEVRIKGSTKTGEVDVHVICIDSPPWLHRITGDHTLVENKWEASSIGSKEIESFHSKAQDIIDCKRAYFVSMSGFSSDSEDSVGAENLIRMKKSPALVGCVESDVEEMISQGSPESFLRNNLK